MRIRVKITDKDRERLAREFELAWNERRYVARIRYEASLAQRNEAN